MAQVIDLTQRTNTWRRTAARRITNWLRRPNGDAQLAAMLDSGYLEDLSPEGVDELARRRRMRENAVRCCAFGAEFGWCPEHGETGRRA